MHRVALAILFACLLVLGACGDDGDDGGSGDQTVIDLLVNEGENPDTAACIADQLQKEGDFSPAEIQAFVSAESEDEELEQAVAAAVLICDDPDDAGTPAE